VSAALWMRRAGFLAVGALASTAPVLLADQTAEDLATTPLRAISAAGAWRDVLEAYRAPQLPPPAETESAIVLLDGPPIAGRPPEARPGALAQIMLQQASVEPVLLGLGATINFRYRAVVNGFGIRVPTGRLALVAELPEVKAIYPVTYLAPAQSSALDPVGQPLPGATTQPAPGPASGPEPATIALIDAGIQPEHPWLGGGIAPNRLIVGGVDFVNGNPGPQASVQGRFAEAHGTELAGLVLRSPALSGLPPEQVPRMLAYRVVAREFVDGRVRPLARSDRVVAAIDRAVDPNEDGNLDDRAEVVLLGVARGFDGGGDDPVANAADAADAAGSLVVAPAGNDGPSFGSVGTVGGPAASVHVLTVGGMGATSDPRTADLELVVGPASAGLTGLPLIGPDPPAGSFPLVVLAGPDGLTSGDEVRDYADAGGRSRVTGAIAVVGRGGGTLATKARAAADAGAVALGVWDQDGPGLFPGIRAGADVPIPVLGLGARQGRVLVENPRFAARIVVPAPGARAAAVASFSSRGPTSDGHLEPDLVAPAIDVETAYPGPAGEALVARMSGTSAAAAQAAAAALRIRVDRPELTPADVRSLLVQAAEPLPGVASTDQGAGALRMPGAFHVSITPAVLSGRRSATTRTRLRLTVRNLTTSIAAYRVALSSSDSGVVAAPGDLVEIPAGAAAEVTVEVPAGVEVFRGTAHVLAADGTTAGVAPVFAQAAPAVPTAALGTPEIREAGDVAEARVAVGLVGRSGNALVVAPLHDLGLWLVPAGGGTPIRMAGEKLPGDWPAGTYRFMLTRRQQSGKELPAGRYRLRVKALGADGVTLVRESAVFRLR
jgi:hypothetical protein